MEKENSERKKEKRRKGLVLFVLSKFSSVEVQVSGGYDHGET